MYILAIRNSTVVIVIAANNPITAANNPTTAANNPTTTPNNSTRVDANNAAVGSGDLNVSFYFNGALSLFEDSNNNNNPVQFDYTCGNEL
ncbi:3797_t:CDS:2 [Entrophospora sp. SA101]|nr:3797_t:CDS:2 [Entrophospora sp. SA101]